MGHLGRPATFGNDAAMGTVRRGHTLVRINSEAFVVNGRAYRRINALSTMAEKGRPSYASHVPPLPVLGDRDMRKMPTPCRAMPSRRLCLGVCGLLLTIPANWSIAALSSLDAASLEGLRRQSTHWTVNRIDHHSVLPNTRLGPCCSFKRHESRLAYNCLAEPDILDHSFSPHSDGVNTHCFGCW